MAKIDRSNVLSQIPKPLRDSLLTAYGEIERNFREHRWELSELNGGKLCEIAYTILKGHVDGVFPPSASKPKNFVEACRDLEKVPKAQFSQAVRVTIPRLLAALYEIRNNRGVGHAGGDVNPNAMDASVVVAGAKWIVSDLIRLFHGVSTEEASAAVESVVERTTALVWEVDKKRRVLKPEMTLKNKTLLLLHSSLQPLHEDDLVSWVEQPSRSNYRRDVLRPLHKDKLIEYDDSQRMVHLSPLGVQHVEVQILIEKSQNL